MKYIKLNIVSNTNKEFWGKNRVELSEIIIMVALILQFESKG